jgi:hypothetical protein
MTGARKWHLLNKLAEKRVAEWNAAYPVGTPVTLKRDDGTCIETKTRSDAQILMSDVAVIWLEGISGCYLLDRVKAR